METVVAAFLVAVAGAINPTIQFLYQRRLNTTPAHERLITLLEKTIDAQGVRLTLLEGELSEMRKENGSLRSEVGELRMTVAQQAIQLAKQGSK